MGIRDWRFMISNPLSDMGKNSMGTNFKRYILAAILGAIAGGVIVALASKTIPKIMAGMMENMMTRMEKSGHNPAEMCQQMMARCEEIRQKKMQEEMEQSS
jgi:uncharacterized protein (DUF697 family)